MGRLLGPRGRHGRSGRRAYGNKWGVFDLGSAQAAAFWGAVAAFVADAIVTVGVTFVHKPKPIEELQGLVYGMANVEENEPADERVWYRKPILLGGSVLALILALNIAFI